MPPLTSVSIPPTFENLGCLRVLSLRRLRLSPRALSAPPVRNAQFAGARAPLSGFREGRFYQSAGLDLQMDSCLALEILKGTPVVFEYVKNDTW